MPIFTSALARRSPAGRLPDAWEAGALAASVGARAIAGGGRRPGASRPPGRSGGPRRPVPLSPGQAAPISEAERRAAEHVGGVVHAEVGAGQADRGGERRTAAAARPERPGPWRSPPRATRSRGPTGTRARWERSASGGRRRSRGRRRRTASLTSVVEAHRRRGRRRRRAASARVASRRRPRPPARSRPRPHPTRPPCPAPSPPPRLGRVAARAHRAQHAPVESAERRFEHRRAGYGRPRIRENPG